MQAKGNRAQLSNQKPSASDRVSQSLGRQLAASFMCGHQHVRTPEPQGVLFGLSESERFGRRGVAAVVVLGAWSGVCFRAAAVFAVASEIPCLGQFEQQLGKSRP